MPPDRRPPVCLTIAGSDSGGGAGIQADLKAFAACGAHGTCAVTALTAQNTLTMGAVLAVPPDFIVAQVRTVVEDLGVDAVKVGMLGSAEVVEAVVEALSLIPAHVPVVVDPVMVAESGARLLDPGAVRALVDRLLPRATVVTPNLPEARVLARARVGDAHAADGGVQDAGVEDGGVQDGGVADEGLGHGRAGDGGAAEAQALARAVHALGVGAVVLTGGHRELAVDLLFDGTSVVELPGPRHPDGAAHGSGCTHASALAAYLAHGFGLRAAAVAARAVAGAAVQHGLRDLGAGAGPVDVLDVRSRMPSRRDA